MPKVGDEYLIRIDSVMTNKKGILYGIEGFKSLVFDDYGLEQLQKFDPQFIVDEMREQRTIAYQQGYADGLSDGLTTKEKVDNKVDQMI